MDDFSHMQWLFICNTSQIAISTPDLFQEFPLPTSRLHLDVSQANTFKWNYLPSPTSCEPTPSLVSFVHKWFHHPIPLGYLCQTLKSSLISPSPPTIYITFVLVSTTKSVSLSPCSPAPSLSLGDCKSLLDHHTPFPAPQGAHAQWLAQGAASGLT